MGELQYKEVDWNNLGTEKEQLAVRNIERFGWLIAIILILIIAFFVTPASDLLLTEEEIRRKYATEYTWVNRCDPACREAANLAFLNQVTNCDTLLEQYDRERTRDLLAWRVAIDDRASSLGCLHFPKSMEQIATDVEETIAVQEERENEWFENQEEQARQEMAQQHPRYEQSLHDGGLLHFSHRLYQDPFDQDTMVIALSSDWFLLDLRKQRQYAQVLWQKWVNIRSPADASKPRLRLVAPDGTVVGGSPADAAQPIWVRLGTTEAS